MQEPQEMCVRSLGWEDPLEKEMATHSNIFAWRIPWIEEYSWLHLWDYKESKMTEATQHAYTHMFPPPLDVCLEDPLLLLGRSSFLWVPMVLIFLTTTSQTKPYPLPNLVLLYNPIPVGPLQPSSPLSQTWLSCSPPPSP